MQPSVERFVAWVAHDLFASVLYSFPADIFTLFPRHAQTIQSSPNPYQIPNEVPAKFKNEFKFNQNFKTSTT
jgi:hypothetical protein